MLTSIAVTLVVTAMVSLLVAPKPANWADTIRSLAFYMASAIRATLGSKR